MTGAVPPPIGSDWKVWARQVSAFIRRNLVRLQFIGPSDVATENGVILWDDVAGYPVVSKGGEYRQIVLADGYGLFTKSTTVTAALPGTAYVVELDAPAAGMADGVALGTPASRIVFDEGGQYILAFSAQIYSSSSSTKTFYFWPRVNGTDIPNNTIVASLHLSAATTVVSRSVTFKVESGDYIEVAWAVDDINAWLQATPATAFSPAAPSLTLSISRFRA
jgi:hypothetical protein